MHISMYVCTCGHIRLCFGSNDKISEVPPRTRAIWTFMMQVTCTSTGVNTAMCTALMALIYSLEGCWWLNSLNFIQADADMGTAHSVCYNILLPFCGNEKQNIVQLTPSFTLVNLCIASLTFRNNRYMYTLLLRSIQTEQLLAMQGEK